MASYSAVFPRAEMLVQQRCAQHRHVALVEHARRPGFVHVLVEGQHEDFVFGIAELGKLRRPTAITRSRLVAMLVLLSISSPIEAGASALEKKLMLCG